MLDIQPDGWQTFWNTNPIPGLYGSVSENAHAYYEGNPFGTSQGDGSEFWRTSRWGKHWNCSPKKHIITGRNMLIRFGGTSRECGWKREKRK